MSEDVAYYARTNKVGFTGTQDGMTLEQKAELTSHLEGWLKLSPNLEFHHGDCIGADAEAAAIARDLGCWVVGHPPSDPKKRAFFKSDEERKPKPYLSRNRDIVAESETVYAAPRARIEQMRSGTWATVRYARAAKKPLVMLLGGI